MMQGDLFINDPDRTAPAELMKAFAVVAAFLHPTFNQHYEDGQSLDSCILVSTVLRDFLFRIGFHDAEVRSVSFVITRIAADKPLHQLMIGEPGGEDKNGKWNGHMVVVLPKAGWLIDATLFQAQRDSWKFLPGMVATPIIDIDKTPQGRTVTTGFAVQWGGDAVQAVWIETPENTRWRSAPAVIRGGRRERARRAVTSTLIEAWKELKQ